MLIKFPVVARKSVEQKEIFMLIKNAKNDKPSTTVTRDKFPIFIAYRAIADRTLTEGGELPQESYSYIQRVPKDTDTFQSFINE